MFFNLDQVALGDYDPNALMCLECLSTLRESVPCFGRRYSEQASECSKCPDSGACSDWNDEDVAKIKVTREGREAALNLIVEQRAKRLRGARVYKKPGNPRPFSSGLTAIFFGMAQEPAGLEMDTAKRMCEDAGVLLQPIMRKLYLGTAPAWEWSVRRTDTHLFIEGARNV